MKYLIKGQTGKLVSYVEYNILFAFS